MIDELNTALLNYQKKWQRVTDSVHDISIFENAKAHAVGWKTTDLNDFDNRFGELRDKSEQIHLVWLNERWIATIMLRDIKLSWGVQVIKLMQRRPNSSDAAGLDHVDFFAPDFGNASIMAKIEPELKWTDEVNGSCKWTSLWFDDTEAKMRRESVIDVSIAEMRDANKRILDLKV
jgi:hypothetical protein